jgi:hypothetical protein
MVEDDEEEFDEDEKAEYHSGLSRAKRLFDNLGFTFQATAERHPDTPSVRSAGVYYRFIFTNDIST